MKLFKHMRLIKIILLSTEFLLRKHMIVIIIQKRNQSIPVVLLQKLWIPKHFQLINNLENSVLF